MRASMKVLSFTMAVLLGGALLASVGFAADPPKDPMANFYANTLISDHGADGLFYVYFNPDHTYKVTHNGKVEREGSYTYENGQLCMAVNGDPKGECPPFNAKMKVGETWIATMKNGKKDPLTLKAGRDNS